MPCAEHSPFDATDAFMPCAAHSPLEATTAEAPLNGQPAEALFAVPHPA